MANRAFIDPDSTVSLLKTNIQYCFSTKDVTQNPLNHVLMIFSLESVKTEGLHQMLTAEGMSPPEIPDPPLLQPERC